MLKHIKIWYRSRKKVEWEPCLCERCNRRIIVDVHHIKCSFHGKRKESEDGSDIIWLCRQCHEYVHAHNRFSLRLELLEKVHNILEDINKECDIQ